MPSQLISFAPKVLTHLDRPLLPAPLWKFQIQQVRIPNERINKLDTDFNLFLQNSSLKYLHKSCAAIKISLKIFYVTEFRKEIINVIFLCFFMDICHEKNPSFDSFKKKM